MPDLPISDRRTPDRRRFPRPISRSRVVLAVSVFLMASLLVSSGGPSTLSLGGSADVEETFAGQPGYGILEEAWAVVRDQYVAIGDVLAEDLVRGASTGMVEGLGDVGHSRFLDPAGAERFRRSIDGTPIGLGVSLSTLNDFLVIRDVIAGGPADVAGVERGDVILRLNGDDVSGLTPADLDPWIDRVAGTTVVLGLYRPASDTELEIPVVQRELEVDTVSWSLLPDDIALVRIASFDRDTAPDLAEAISASKAAGATSIVLDLRDNPGGLVEELVNAVSLFLPADIPVFQTVDGAGTVNRWPTVGGAISEDLPLAVLVNRNSASAAEIMASTLAYYGRAQTIGQTTFGTGTILYSTDLSDGSAVVIGRELWQTPGGETVWLTGYQPDEEVVLDYGDVTFIAGDEERVARDRLNRSEDDQLLAATEYLASGGAAADTPGTPGATPGPVVNPVATPAEGESGVNALALNPDALASLR
ncbi:MAG TPA: S41 family peptidase [Thermomicrobiales bacterium]|nr:S41 family peptidase [Thermomicrobiales bacterium]